MRSRSQIDRGILFQTIRGRLYTTRAEYAFLDSIKAGNIEKVRGSLEASENKSLLRARYPDEPKDVNRGNYALHVAYEYGYLHVANFLLDQGEKNGIPLLADINSIGVAPWVHALLYFNRGCFIGLKSTENARQSLDHFFNTTEFQASFLDCPTLESFVRTLHLGKSEHLVEQARIPALVTERDPFGFSALHYAIASDSLVAVESLLQNPALNSQKALGFLKAEDINGNTGLHIAVPNVSEVSKIVPRLLRSLKESARSENPRKNLEISERFELRNFLYQPNYYGFDPFHLALTIDSIKNFSKVFFRFGYDIREPAYVVHDRQGDMNRVFQVPCTLIAFKWLEGFDEKIKNILQWLFRHGSDLDNLVSYDTLEKLGMSKVVDDFCEKQSIADDEKKSIKMTLADIADVCGYGKTREFLLENGAGFSDFDRTSQFYTELDSLKDQNKDKHRLLHEVQSFSSYKNHNSDPRNAQNNLRELADVEDVLDQRNKYGHNPFSLSIVHGYVILVEKMLSKWPELISKEISLNFDARDQRVSTNTSIHLAVRYGKDKGGLSFYQDKEHNQCAVLQVLLNEHAIWCENVTIDLLLKENDKNLTALNLASRNGYLLGVKTLIKLYLSKIPTILKEEKLTESEKTNLIRLVRDIRKSLHLAHRFQRFAIQRFLFDTLSSMSVVAQQQTDDVHACKVLCDLGFIDRRGVDSGDRSLFDSMVFQGGGVRGISHVGAIEQLEKTTNEVVNLKNLAYVGGTSGGAIIAALFGCGHASEKLKTIVLTELELLKLLDGSKKDYEALKRLYQRYYKEKESVDLKEVDKEFAKKIKQFVVSISSYIFKPFYVLADLRDFARLAYRLRNELGIFSGNELRLVIEKYVYDETEIEHITFEELYIYACVVPKMKEVSLVAVDTMRKKSHVFSRHQDPHHVVSDATLSSASIPLFFRPHQRYIKPPGRKRALDITDGGALYVDGGMNDNYPEWLFKDVSRGTLGVL